MVPRVGLEPDFVTTRGSTGLGRNVQKSRTVEAKDPVVEITRLNIGYVVDCSRQILYVVVSNKPYVKAFTCANYFKNRN